MDMHDWIYRFKYDGVYKEIEITASTRRKAMAQGRNEAMGMMSHQSIERVKSGIEELEDIGLDYDKTIEPEDAQCNL